MYFDDGFEDEEPDQEPGWEEVERGRGLGRPMAGDVIRIGPGRPMVGFDLRCPVCGDRVRTPELVSPAIDDEGGSCSHGEPASRWIEWHECLCCGEWFSLIVGQ